MNAPVSKIFGPVTVMEMAASRDLTAKVLERVQRACECSDGRFTLDAVVNGLADKSLSVWGVVQKAAAHADLSAVAVSRVTPWESGVKVFELLLLGGPAFEDMLHFLDRFEAPARREGCSRIRLYGRTSWGGLHRRGGRKYETIMPKGWRVAAVVYERDLLTADARATA